MYFPVTGLWKLLRQLLLSRNSMTYITKNTDTTCLIDRAFFQTSLYHHHPSFMMKTDKISPFTVSDPEQWSGWPSLHSTSWPRFTRARPRPLSPPHGSSASSRTACTLSEANTAYILRNHLQIKGALQDTLPCSSLPHPSLALLVWTWARLRRSEGVDESSLWLNANPLYSWCWGFPLTAACCLIPLSVGVQDRRDFPSDSGSKLLPSPSLSNPVRSLWSPGELGGVVWPYIQRS